MMPVKLDKLSVTQTVENAKKLLAEDPQISPALKAMFELLLTIITLLAGRLSLNSRNSSKPPASDPNRNKKAAADSEDKKKPGGQPGRVGVNLKPVSNPDKIIPIPVDRSTLPKGQYREAAFESRQVIDIEISSVITEYRAQILTNENGDRFVAPFPEGIVRPIQYGCSIKTHAVYLSQYQLLPYERTADYFLNQASIPISVGSLCNFNKEAYDRLNEFDELAKQKLIASPLLHSDETSINVNGDRIWLHNASNELWTYFYPHQNRGGEAMDEIGILPEFTGILVHDHWKPYYIYSCLHALCNAHHLRELQWVIDNFNYAWPRNMQELLLNIKKAVDGSKTGVLSEEESNGCRERYRQIIQAGIAEMPPLPPSPSLPDGKKKRGRKKKSKELNLLERLGNYEDDVLRFMVISFVPFTNNRGENDIRMTKVQQKISGCFKSMEGAKIFCRIRSYLLTAQKHGISPSTALQTLFKGKLPEIFYSSS
jgi:transposase